MSDFDPGPGWREVSSATYANHRREKLRIDPSSEDNGLSRYWVREVPVPALPTAPYTVIRVTWKDEEKFGKTVLVMNEDGRWWDQRHVGLYAEGVEERITSFKVLSEPRAVTAKAVLDRVAAIHPTPMQSIELARIAREFGVKS